jgi:glucose-1-phosphate cytidylyltransferase
VSTKTVILAGGLGTRLSEETEVRPKPMVEVGGKPILWHIMKIYSSWGFNDFIICLGYKGYMIKEFFANYFLHQSDLTIDLKSNKLEILNNNAEPWRITLVDTGDKTMTGGRLRRIRSYLNDEPFMVTYGDGVADIDVTDLLRFHRSHGKTATVTAVRPPSRFGGMALDEAGDGVTDFIEKPQIGEGWINGGFFVFEPGVIDRIDGDATLLEREPLEGLACDGQLAAYRHMRFWQCMDTLRDVHFLNDLWNTGTPPWKVWQ